MSNPAVKAGITFGVIVALIGAIDIGISTVVTSSLTPPTADEAPAAYVTRIAGPLLIIGGAGVLAFIVDVVLYLLAGRSAARQTGTVGSGAIAGIVAAVVAGIIGLVIQIGLSAAGVATAPKASPTAAAITIGEIITNAIIATIIGGAIAAGVGALGGLIGRDAYQKANATAVPMGYPPRPMQ